MGKRSVMFSLQRKYVLLNELAGQPHGLFIPQAPSMSNRFNRFHLKAMVHTGGTIRHVYSKHVCVKIGVNMGKP
jgi:hypothetical protein